jgi:hypothetical protein
MSDDNSKGSSDESIGRPSEWREGRYQQPGKPVGDTVRIPDEARQGSTDRISTPVTQRDYQQRKSVAGSCSLSHWNVG